jgi:hypothetical protein
LSEVVIQPIEHRLYQLRTLFCYIMRRVQHQVAFVSSGCAQHRKKLILCLSREKL